MSMIEIGEGKRGRRGYSFDEVAIAPSRRTRDPRDVSVAWQIDAYPFEHPIVAAPMDSVVSPQSAKQFAAAGGLAVLNLEGLWTRYADPSDIYEEIASLDVASANARLQEVYAVQIDPELVRLRVQEMRESGATVAGALSPQNTQELREVVVNAGVDIFVIRGTTVSAEHVSTQVSRSTSRVHPRA